MNSLPEPHKLVLQETGAIVAYACRDCGLIVSPIAFGGGSASFPVAEEYAKEHCHRTCSCDAALDPGRSRCEACWKQDQAERDELRYQLADKFLESEYIGPVYWEGKDGSMGPGYFSSIEEVRALCADEELEVPEHVWACREVELKIEVEDVLKHIFAGHEDVARDQLPEGAEVDLGHLLEAWCAQQNIRSWQVDFTRAIVLENQ